MTTYTIPTFSDTEEKVDASTLRPGDFLVRTWSARFRGPRGGSYIVKAIAVNSGIVSFGGDGRGNLTVKTIAHKGVSLVLYPGQQVTVRRATGTVEA